jgi:glyoxylase-like metal-dependent hydrolase (beta-lactamase superfamily II)
VTPPYRVLAVRYATRGGTKSESYYRYFTYGEPDAPLRMDYFFWLLEGEQGTIVVDTGFDPEIGARRNRECLIEPAAAFAKLGIDCEAVELVVVTHLHWDHTGNLDLFPNAHLVVPKRELDFWTSPLASRHHLAELVIPEEVAQVVHSVGEGRVTLVSGTQEIAPGITAVDVGGHSPGQLVLVVASGGGPVVLASDAIHYYEELELDRPFDVFVDLAESYRALDTLRELTRDGQPLVAGHDPLVMDRFRRLDGELAELAVEIA